MDDSGPAPSAVVSVHSSGRGAEGLPSFPRSLSMSVPLPPSMAVFGFDIAQPKLEYGREGERFLPWEGILLDPLLTLATLSADRPPKAAALC